MSHTKGPWTFDTSIENDVYLGQILAPSRAIVSLFRHHDRNDKNGQLQEDLANAQLIAAAPAMKEALEGLLESADLEVLPDQGNEFDCTLSFSCHHCGRHYENDCGLAPHDGLCQDEECPSYKARKALTLANGGTSE